MDVSTTGNEFYAVGDVALYATDNLRLSVGASTVAGFESAHAGLNGSWATPAFRPRSRLMGASARITSPRSWRASPLLRRRGQEPDPRHREDDPRIRFFDIFNAGVLGSGTLGEECVDDLQNNFLNLQWDTWIARSQS